MNREKIEDTLLAMGVPAGILGFNYIVDAIQIFDEKGTDIQITKELYPTIAKKNNTTPSRTERATDTHLRLSEAAEETQRLLIII